MAILPDYLIAHANKIRFRYFHKAPVPVDFNSVRELRNDAFPQGEPDCWLYRIDAMDEIERRLGRGKITQEQAEACRFWVDNGYLVVSGLIDDATLDAAWAAYERALDAGTFGEPKYAPGSTTMRARELDPHLKVPEIRALQHHPAILAWTDLFFDRKTVPFQTIMGHAGSQQRAHSDSIHMTTYPLGYLVASWLAFEDISPDSGPLDYYPGSHKLPYLLSAEAGIAQREFKEKGYGIYHERYEPMIEEACRSAGLKREVFLAKKGDILFWHANLVHGGTPRRDHSLSRKALVCHYFAEKVVTYHDLSGNHSRLHKDGMYARVSV